MAAQRKSKEGGLTGETIAKIGLAGLGLWTAYKILSSLGDAAGKVGAALNPANDKNLANKVAVKITQAVTGDSSATPGSLLYNVTDPGYASYDSKAKNSSYTAPTAGQQAAAVATQGVYALTPIGAAAQVISGAASADQALANWIASALTPDVTNYDPNASNVKLPNASATAGRR
jgi:hypothetical protein